MKSITYDVYVCPPDKTIPVDKLIFELNCLGTQQRSGSTDKDFVIGMLKTAGRIVKTTNNL
jgi:hypothetical protein